MQITEAIDDYLKQNPKSGLREYTALGSEFRAFCEAHGAQTVDQITPSIVAGYKHARALETNWRNTNKELKAVERFCTMVSRWGYIPKKAALAAKPLKGPVVSDKPEGLSKPQVQALMWAIRKTQPPWVYHMVHTALLTGAKLIELISLEWAHIRFNDRLILLSPPNTVRQFHPVPIPECLAEELDDWQQLGKKYGANGPWVFGTRPIEPENAKTALREAMFKAGLKGNWRTLRHTYVYGLFSAGATEQEVAGILNCTPSMVGAVYGRPEKLETADMVAGLVL